ncbi:MAG: hypothetical protein GTN70_08340 [Deltaproteobacteria bacterium]|nr:hypothetical protein [Deltaproteobacteria bacterium]NIS77708.1 hypothetical protein [Deltaproteobacteria bacterium]
MKEKKVYGGRGNIPPASNPEKADRVRGALVLVSALIVAFGVGFSGLETVTEGRVIDRQPFTKMVYSDTGSPQAEVLEIVSEAVREVTAYNVGVVAQTDDRPCIGATGDDLCEMIFSGDRICASNGFPLGTRLLIENYGECRVLDRMNRRYRNRVDIAMGPDEVQRAIDFGIQRLRIAVLEEVE